MLGAWIYGCLVAATVTTGGGWWLAAGSARHWRSESQKQFDRHERMVGYLADTLRERNVAQAERDEARAQLAMTLRRDPTTGRFQPRETSNGRSLQH